MNHLTIAPDATSYLTTEHGLALNVARALACCEWPTAMRCHYCGDPFALHCSACAGCPTEHASSCERAS